MSDWIGPNVYRIESCVDRTKHISLDNGLKEENTKIWLWTANEFNRWEFAYAGIGKSGKDEYLLINTHSGTLMTTVANPTEYGNHVIGTTLSPLDNRVRWHVIPTRSGAGTYWYLNPQTLVFILRANNQVRITTATDPKLKLTNSWLKTDIGTHIDPWDCGLDSKHCCWYLRLADDASLPCPDLGKATV